MRSKNIVVGIGDNMGMLLLSKKFGDEEALHSQREG
jgi:hypothetical protein